MVPHERSHPVGYRRAEETWGVLEDGAADGEGDEEDCTECVCTAAAGRDTSTTHK